jgi:hypothetical protein
MADAFVLLFQEIHGEMDTDEMAAGDGQIAGCGGPACQHDGMEFPEEVACADARADFRVAFEYDAGFFHQFYPPGHYPFFQFEIGNPIAEQTTGLIISFEDGDGVTGGIELIGGGQSGGAGADDGHFLAGTHGWVIGLDESFIESDLDDMFFYFFDGYGWLVDAQYATALAWGRADPPGEFGEIVGGAKDLIGLLPLLAVYVVVELGNDIAEGAAVMAEGDTAIHAPGRLVVELFAGVGVNEFIIVVPAFLDGTFGG